MEPVGTGQERAQVACFYEQIWNRHNKAVIPQVLDRDFIFCGSLGNTSRGYPGFIEYLDGVHAALDDYACRIEEMVVEPPRVFTKMQFHGVHRGILLGYPPTGKRVAWAGAALFTFKQDKIAKLWVLGDIKSLESQLAGDLA